MQDKTIFHPPRKQFFQLRFNFATYSFNKCQPCKQECITKRKYSKQSGTGKTAVMYRKSKILQQQESKSGQASDSNTDRCLTGRLGSQLHGYGDRGEMASRREENYINILELLPVKSVILAFTKEKTINAIHIQIDSTTALSHLLKMGGNTDKTLVDLSKDIWKI